MTRLPPDGSRRDGQGEDLESLLVEHLPFVRAFLRLRMDHGFRARESVSDLVQSVCRKVLERADKFAYQGREAFRAWLCNAALLELRQKRRHHRAAMRDVGREARIAEDARVSTIITNGIRSPLSDLILAEDQDRIERAFDLLTDAQREVLTLSRIVGLSHPEIAEHLGISVTNSRTLLNRAKAAFATRWEELGA